MRGIIIYACLLCCALARTAEARTVRALFLGNSYTQYNNLPDLVSKMALAGGDTLYVASNTPGGYTLQGHATNTTSLDLIARGNWDYVILQEQSQLPSFSDARVARDVYPYAAILDSLVRKDNACATTLLYMTWGRKNGDRDNCGGLPWVCTYESMDSVLQLRYTIMAERNGAALSPVAGVWRKLRTEHPALELYTGDESHPSNNGSFAAACAFYAVMFGKDPVLNSYNFNLSATDAGIIKAAAKAVAFDRLDDWFQYATVPQAAFTAAPAVAGRVEFTNVSAHASRYLWIFGDGATSDLDNPAHTYTARGQYDVQLVAYRCNALTDTVVQTIRVDSVAPSGIGDIAAAPVQVYPNPVTNLLTVQAPGIMLQDLAIIDVLGRKATGWRSVALKKDVLEIDASALPAGTYYILLRTDAGYASGRFTRQ